MNMITDKRFLIGAAIGFLVGPRAAKHVRAALEKLKGAAA